MNKEGGFLIRIILFLSVFVFSMSYAQAEIGKRSYALNGNTEVSYIVIKFKDGAGVKLRNGQLIYQSNTPLPPGLSAQKLADELETVESLVRDDNLSVSRIFHSMSEGALDELRMRGEGRLKKKLQDLNLFHSINLPAHRKFANVEKLLERLNTLDIVEIAYAQPTPEPATHLVTPDFEGNQGYLLPPPNGIDAQFAWTVNGGRGQGINIIDVEGAWRNSHEDMPVFFSDSGNHFNDLNWRNHGTAVLGVIGAMDNGDGVTGIANQAAIGVQSINGTTTANAIIQAANTVGVGGIVLIELHAEGPNDGTACTCNVAQCNFIAMEFWQANFAAIQTATANGVIVVEAAGNGSADLDSAAYNNAFNRNVADSGAILVGASLSNQRSPTCWTNFGTRVDVHGWGENVATLGYGDLFTGGHGEEDRFYTAQFSGTSSASPIVVGATASIQGVANNLGLPLYNSVDMRQLLVTTGTAQTNDLARNIGALPNLREAIESIGPPPPPQNDLAWLPAVLGLLLF